MGFEISHVVLVATFVGNFVSLGLSQALPAVYYSLWLDLAGVEAGLTALIASTNIGLIGIVGKVLFQNLFQCFCSLRVLLLISAGRGSSFLKARVKGEHIICPCCQYLQAIFVQIYG